MLVTPETLTLNIIDTVFIVFATIAFVVSVKILWKWDFQASSQEQYNLQKLAYLSATIIKFIFYIKIPLFLFFVFTLDKISNILPGAMCAAGVVDATSYGTPLLFLKVLNLYLFGFWLVLNKEDMKSESQRYLKIKFYIFIIAYILFMIEIAIEWMMFASMDIYSVVDCCGAIFSTTSATYLAEVLRVKHMYLLGIFYTTYFLCIGFFVIKNRYLFAVVNLIYLVIALITLIAFFGTYIYQQPMHHCPFCMLQDHYEYIGYFLYTALFLGTFYGFLGAFIHFTSAQEARNYKISLLFNTLYLAIVSFYPLKYYIDNGVWL